MPFSDGQLASMAKREFVMLAQKYKADRHPISGYFASEKLDGLRCLWDGGISTGLLASEVPYANTDRKEHLLSSPIATGLWTRYGNVIHAPQWFLDQLPPFCLDGELWIDRRQFQLLTSIVKDHEPDHNAWRDVKYVVFDCPSYREIFCNGEISGTNFTKSLVGVQDWCLKRSEKVHLAKLKPEFVYAGKAFEQSYKILQSQIPNTDNLIVHEQTQLDLNPGKAQIQLQKMLELVLDEGGEGIMLRNPSSFWTPQRSNWLLKFKGVNDAEGTVKGYKWGKLTDRGSKLLGLMGSLTVSLENGKSFDLSGFTDEERLMVFKGTQIQAGSVGVEHPGEIVSDSIESKHFPRGSKITFTYRELSDDGIPKEARYLRKAE